MLVNNNQEGSNDQSSSNIANCKNNLIKEISSIQSTKAIRNRVILILTTMTACRSDDVDLGLTQHDAHPGRHELEKREVVCLTMLLIQRDTWLPLDLLLFTNSFLCEKLTNENFQTSNCSVV
jgi:hypothetical protein